MSTAFGETLTTSRLSETVGNNVRSLGLDDYFVILCVILIVLLDTALLNHNYFISAEPWIAI